MNNKYKAVIFDLDGTLLDTLEDICDSTNSLLNRRGLPQHNMGAYRIMVGEGVIKLVERAFPDEFFNDHSLDETVAELINEYKLRGDDKTKPYDGITDVLSALQKAQVSISIFTNKPQMMAERAINKHLSHYPFDQILGVQMGIPPKPDPLGVNQIMQSLAVGPQECLFVGDSDIDMATAENADIDGIGVSWGFRARAELEKSNAMRVIDHPTELLEFFP
jgi:phosphoglycolate phosphatase